MRPCVVLSLTTLLLAAIAFAQTGFSADVVDLKQPGTPVIAKMYFAAEQMRIEPQQMSPRNAPPIADIMYLKPQTQFRMLLRDRVYAQIPPQEDWWMYTSFLSGSVDDACDIWDKTSHTHSRTCRKVGDDTLNGRPTVKYEGRCSNKNPCHIWIDRRLRFLVKWEDGSNGRELRNIEEGTQPNTLFEIPRGFNRVQATTGTIQSTPAH